MDQSKQFTAKQLWDKVAATPQKTTVLVTGQYASQFRSLPNDGRVYIIQDHRRPWVHHVTHANGAYSRIDDKNPRIHVAVRVICKGKKSTLPSRYEPKPKQRQIEELQTSASEKGSGALPIRLIDIKRVMSITGFKKSFLYEQASVGFPLPIRLGSSRRAAARWVESEIIQWVEVLMSKRHSAQMSS
jgi:predicted DNA-binding transcriptional regulator AlpA